MSEKRQKSASILLKFSGKASVKVELFPAEAWAGKLAGARPGLYRLRVSGAWVDGLFSEAEACAALPTLAGRVAQDQEAPPMLPKGSRVGAPTGRTLPDGRPTFDVTFTDTPPFRGYDGRYRVFVCGRAEPELVENLEGR